jgi:hypothetical protein
MVDVCEQSVVDVVSLLHSVVTSGEVMQQGYAGHSRRKGSWRIRFLYLFDRMSGTETLAQ